jgi:hypothetical protein
MPRSFETPDAMRPSIHHAAIACALLLPALLPAGRLAAGGAPPGPAVGVRLDPSKTWVGPARVHLDVGDLKLSGHELQGEYRIRVPLRPSENDVGTIRLAAFSSLEQMQKAGGTLIGDARSAYGKVHLLLCEVRPGGDVLIDVISDVRTMTFKTRLHPLHGR